MPETKEISYQIRHLIVSDCCKKLRYRVIARKCNLSKSAVGKIYKKYLVHKTVKNLKGRGRKRCTTIQEDRRIFRISRKDPTITGRIITKIVEVNVSTKTIKRRLHEADLRCCKARLKFGGGSLMVWGCFSRNGSGTLMKIDGIMNADKYINILNENLEEAVVKMGCDDEFVFQQDNDPKHIAKKTKKFFKDSNIKLLE
ncbi:uncharacterized protein LOC143352207 [Halictus rubicundus]|uniref:uncharacterized protein LOC143352207 n=1 Tax=Halictus rubicundus TaxID=77578 RepID=UPI00403527FE